MNDYDKTVCASGLASIVAGCVLFALGCEDSGRPQEPDLQGAKIEAVEYINSEFGTHGNADTISVSWGDLSLCWVESMVIEINDSLVGQPDAIRCHMRHEVFHALTGLYDGVVETFNGVRIADKIAWVK